jgi:hypothetical protein
MRQDGAVEPLDPEVAATAADDARFRLPRGHEWVVLLGYAAASALYILIGVTVTDFLLSVFVAIGYLLIVVWLVPLAVRRLL